MERRCACHLLPAGCWLPAPTRLPHNLHTSTHPPPSHRTRANMRRLRRTTPACWTLERAAGSRPRARCARYARCRRRAGRRRARPASRPCAPTAPRPRPAQTWQACRRTEQAAAARCVPMALHSLQSLSRAAAQPAAPVITCSGCCDYLQWVLCGQHRQKAERGTATAEDTGTVRQRASGDESSAETEKSLG